MKLIDAKAGPLQVIIEAGSWFEKPIVTLKYDFSHERVFEIKTGGLAQYYFKNSTDVKNEGIPKDINRSNLEGWVNELKKNMMYEMPDNCYTAIMDTIYIAYNMDGVNKPQEFHNFNSNASCKVSPKTSKKTNPNFINLEGEIIDITDSFYNPNVVNSEYISPTVIVYSFKDGSKKKYDLKNKVLIFSEDNTTSINLVEKQKKLLEKLLKENNL